MASAAPFVLGEQGPQLVLLSGLVHDTHEVVGGDEFIQAGRGQTGLVHLAQLEDDLVVFAAHAPRDTTLPPKTRIGAVHLDLFGQPLRLFIQTDQQRQSVQHDYGTL